MPRRQDRAWTTGSRGVGAGIGRRDIMIGLRETLVDRDGRAGALWPDGRAQEPAGEDHHDLALSGPPDDGRACGRGIANGRCARETLENSRSVPDSGEPILLVRDDPGGDRRGRADHRPDPHHEGVPSRSLTLTLRGFLAAGKRRESRGAAFAPPSPWT